MLFSRRVDSLPFWPFQFLIDPKLHKSRRELPHRLSAGQSHTMRRGSVTSFRGESTSKPYRPTELAGTSRCERAEFSARRESAAARMFHPCSRAHRTAPGGLRDRHPLPA